MKTPENFLKEKGINKDNYFYDLALELIKGYANQKLDEASEIALNFEKEIISEKILSLQD